MIEFETATQPKARKQHKCYLCGGPIVYGERYFRHSGKCDGEFFDYCYHDECSDLIDSYSREFNETEWDHDAIWDWLCDHCHDCQHGTEQDNDCTVSVLRCQLIRDKFREERRRKNQKEESGDAD